MAAISCSLFSIAVSSCFTSRYTRRSISLSSRSASYVAVSISSSSSGTPPPPGCSSPSSSELCCASTTVRPSRFRSACISFFSSFSESSLTDSYSSEFLRGGGTAAGLVTASTSSSSTYGGAGEGGFSCYALYSFPSWIVISEVQSTLSAVGVLSLIPFNEYLDFGSFSPSS